MKKKLILLLGIFFSIGFVITSCNDDDVNFTRVPVSAILSLETEQISTFDINRDIQIDIDAEDNTSVSAISVIRDGQVISNATVSGDMAAFSSSDFGTLSPGDIDLDLQYTLSDGGPFTVKEESLTVVPSLSFSEEVSSVIFRDESSIAFSTFTTAATIDNVTVFWKIGEDGMFSELSGPFNTAGETLDITPDQYIDVFGAQKNDEIFFRVEATSGALMEEIETSFTLLPQAFNGNQSFTIGTADSNKEVNLTDPAADDDSDIMYEAPSGFTGVMGGDISFVQITTTDDLREFYDEYNDVEVAMADFDAGTAQASIQPSAGDLYLYRVTRGDDNDVFYGIMLISDITETQVVTNEGVTSNTVIEFDAKENAIIQ